MSIIFHEGLPRSGKSYEAMVLQIIPALKAGRFVDMYLEGPDSSNPDCPYMAKIAEAAELPKERVYELVRTMTADQVPQFYRYTRSNSLVVLDEAQDFWPTGRQRLDPQTTKAITQHGHLGQDFLLMGQVLTDVHKLWRGRVEQKNVYVKLKAVGLENRYTVTVYTAPAGGEKFHKVTFGQKAYEEKYFGTYASHVDKTIQTGNFKDKRANILSTNFTRYALPVSLLAGAWGLWVAWGFFHPKPVQVASPVAAASAPSASAPSAAASQPSVAVKRTFVGRLNDKYRSRLAYFYRAHGLDYGAIEWYDGETLRERLTFVQLTRIGATVRMLGDDVASVDGEIATPWPKVDVKGPQTVQAVATSFGVGS